MQGIRSQTRPSRVAVVCEGDPSDPTAWSGTPYGLITGLRSHGVEVVPVQGELAGVPGLLARDGVAILTARPSSPRPSDVLAALRTSRQAAPHTAAFGNVATTYVAAGLRRRGAFDGVVQIGTSYAVRHPRLVTFEDMTVRQAVDHAQYHWADISPEQLDKRIARQGRAYARSRAALTATPWAARSIVEDYHVDEDKVAAVGLGRNHDPLDSADVNRDWRLPRFLFVGQDWERKNGDAVIRAFRRIRDEHPEASLDVVGGHPALDEPGVRGHGRLRLSHPDERRASAELFARATCLVVPSTFEAAGIVYLEAGAVGIPSIGTTRGGASDMIGEGGLTVDPGDFDGLVEAMRRLTETGYASRLGAVAKDRSDRFTWEAVAARVLDRLGLGAGDSIPAGW